MIPLPLDKGKGIKGIGLLKIKGVIMSELTDELNSLQARISMTLVHL